MLPVSISNQEFDDNYLWLKMGNNFIEYFFYLNNGFLQSTTADLVYRLGRFSRFICYGNDSRNTILNTKVRRGLE